MQPQQQQLLLSSRSILHDRKNQRFVLKNKKLNIQLFSCRRWLSCIQERLCGERYLVVFGKWFECRLRCMHAVEATRRRPAGACAGFFRAFEGLP